MFIVWNLVNNNKSMLYIFHNVSDNWDSLWIPLFISPHNLNYFNWSIKIVYLVEFILLFVAFAIFWICLFGIMKISLFHRNLLFLVQFLIGFYYLAIVGRIGILAYQLKFIKIYGDPMKDWPLILSSIFRMLFFGTAAAFLPAILLERTFATILAEDYEKKTRPQIAILLIVLSEVTAVLLMWSIFYDLLRFSGFVVLAVSIVLLSTVLFSLVYYYNVSFLRRLQKSSGISLSQYTLQLRFQITENVRAMRVVKNSVFVCGTTAIICISPLTIAQIIDKSTPTGELFSAIFDMMIALAPHVIITLGMIFIPELNEVVMETFANLFKLRRDDNAKVQQRVNKLDRPMTVDSYFAKMKTAWA